MDYFKCSYKAQSDSQEDGSLLDHNREAAYKLSRPGLYYWIFWMLSVLITSILMRSPSSCEENPAQLIEALNGYCEIP